MPQLQINQGPQDALLYDNSRSYFTNVGYVRTSNFQVEYRDVDPQNSANLGSTVQFVIPKAADLLGCVDLLVDFAQPTNTAGTNAYAAWVESVGYAMIERITFSVGSHDVETITGEQLNIINELMRNDEMRMHSTIGKTARPAIRLSQDTSNDSTYVVRKFEERMISHGSNTMDGQKLIIPLGLFFTKHPSQYFPLAAIAGCNDVRIAIKFRTLNELVQLGTDNPTKSPAGTDAMTFVHTNGTRGSAAMPAFNGSVFDRCRLRCHYVHVTGPEATTLMNKEHVRLLKLFQHNSKVFNTTAGNDTHFDIDLSFLHPVQELIITVRKLSEINSSTSLAAEMTNTDQQATTKAYFAYHGNGKDPNLDSYTNSFLNASGKPLLRARASDGTGTKVDPVTIRVNNFKLTLNGQERHPSLAGVGLDRDYLVRRLLPMMHSNTSTTYSRMNEDNADEAAMVSYFTEMFDQKNIFVYPFCLNPESSNPSGAVNFSKVSHAKLSVDVSPLGPAGENCEYVLDVYGVYYNWLQIKDGRALTSFA